MFQDPYASLNPRMRVETIVAEPLIVNERLPASEVRHRGVSSGWWAFRRAPPNLYPHAGGLTLPGEVPSPLPPPAGCRVHPRYPHAMPRCAAEEPPLRPAGGRLVARHLYDPGPPS